MSKANTTARMKTVLIDGVPCRIRADMPAGYLETLEQDRLDDEREEAYREGFNAGYNSTTPYPD